MLVDLSRGEVVVLVEGDIEKPLVVTEIEISFAPVVQDKHLAVLERGHGAGIAVKVRVDLDRGDGKPTSLQENADRGGGHALPEPGDDPAWREEKWGVGREGVGRGKGARSEAGRGGARRRHRVARESYIYLT